MPSKGRNGRNIYNLLRGLGIKSNYRLFGKQSTINNKPNNRHMPGGLEEAKKMFDVLSIFKVGDIKQYLSKNDNGFYIVQVMRLSDGTTITFKESSNSDGTPTIDFIGGHSFRKQHIHFVEEENKK